MAMEKLFDHFDRNHDGKISSDEFSLAIKGVNPATADEDIKSMMEEVDTNGDGSIDMNEFTDFFDEKNQKKEWEGEGKDADESLMEAFKTYDLDGDGFISIQELQTVMMRLHINCSVEDCAKMIEGVDSDGNGRVDFQDFKNMMVGGSTEFLRKN
ncbi:Calcium-binding protein CML24 [Zostera marina]|uniref:Calcium-binding protein CML24 n=1 Tax=Zostera marina TaxID=29655 RepID=A0A0K9NK21_ZOSMR|nr:Calcium-binding protein CML24 [Zostera marina]